MIKDDKDDYIFGIPFPCLEQDYSVSTAKVPGDAKAKHHYAP